MEHQQHQDIASGSPAEIKNDPGWVLSSPQFFCVWSEQRRRRKQSFFPRLQIICLLTLDVIVVLIV